jgi:hypothetical protein
VSAPIKEAFSGVVTYAPGTSIQGLAAGAAWQMTPVDNTSGLYIDAQVQIILKTGTSGPFSNYVTLYAFASLDGTHFPDALGATEGLVSPWSTTPNLKQLGLLSVSAVGTIYRSDVFSVGALYGGTLPPHWGLCLYNNSGAALDGTAGNFSILWAGAYGTSV